jgi:hypothetical protein
VFENRIKDENLIYLFVQCSMVNQDQSPRRLTVTILHYQFNSIGADGETR